VPEEEDEEEQQQEHLRAREKGALGRADAEGHVGNERGEEAIDTETPE
jgi:hypothetical protein